VFVRDTQTGAWAETQQLNGSDAGNDLGFGGAVSISGDIAIIGADSYAIQWQNDGAAFVFTRDAQSGTWVETQKLTASDATVGALFGSSVSMVGEVAVIGATNSSFSNPGPGWAYVFERDSVAGTWVETQKLTPSGTAPLDLFGAAVAVTNDVAFVTAPSGDGAGDDAGAAYVFERGVPTDTAPDDPSCSDHVLAGGIVGGEGFRTRCAGPASRRRARRPARERSAPAGAPHRWGACGVYAVRIAIGDTVAARLLTLLR
jgi:hypothetical protein